MISSYSNIYLVYITASNSETYSFSMESHPYEEEPEDNKFIVTLTPTAEDYSGTMDKTVGEIYAAYYTGMEIWFFFEVSGTGSFEFKCDTVGRDPGHIYPSFNGGMYYGNTMMRVNTLTTDDSTKQTYSTEVYSLTPAS